MAGFDDEDPFVEGAAAPSSSAAVSNDSGEGDVFDLPPTPVGVRNGYIKDVKYNDKNSKWIFSIQCTDSPYQNAPPVDAWLGGNQLKAFIAAFGITVTIARGKAKTSAPISSLKNQPGKFVFGTYVKDGEERPTILAYVPKQDKSPTWDVSDQSRGGDPDDETSFAYSDEQIKAINSSAQGVIRSEHTSLF